MGCIFNSITCWFYACTRKTGIKNQFCVFLITFIRLDNLHFWWHFFWRVQSTFGCSYDVPKRERVIHFPWESSLMKKSETESYCIIQDVAHINNLYGVYKTNDIKVTEYYLNLIVYSYFPMSYFDVWRLKFPNKLWLYIVLYTLPLITIRAYKYSDESLNYFLYSDNVFLLPIVRFLYCLVGHSLM